MQHTLRPDSSLPDNADLPNRAAIIRTARMRAAIFTSQTTCLAINCTDCKSDLQMVHDRPRVRWIVRFHGRATNACLARLRSEERRVGKGGRCVGREVMWGE